MTNFLHHVNAKGMHFLFFLLIFNFYLLNGQAVGINEDGSPPDPASILDVKSPDKGVLFPRMDEARRLSIPSPPEGLMVWDTTHNSIWGFDGSQWRELASKWERTSGGIRNTNSDNVGIGEVSANHSLYIRKPSPSLAFYDDDYPSISGAIRGDSTALIIHAYRQGLIGGTSPGHLVLQKSTVSGGITTFAAGNVGIGMADPDQKLSLNGTLGFYEGNSSRGVIDYQNGDTRINAKRGTINFAPSGDLILQQINEFPYFAGRVGIGVSEPLAKLHVSSTVLIGANAQPAFDYLLSVDGKIMAEEMRIEDSGTWPDYVFEDSYNLRSLASLKHAISTNGHLPGIPSAKEIEMDGILVGDMQKRQMEKIEELTLYIIQLHERIEKLEKALSEMQKGTE